MIDRLHWVTMTDTVGIGYGYSSHQKNLHAALVRAGVTMDDAAPVALHITTPDAYRPIPGKRNILYTMYEATSIPKTWRAPLGDADLIVVPCVQNRHLFQQYTDTPVEVVWEGVDPQVYRYTERTEPKDRPFMFLWVGATNPRKGTEHMCWAWTAFLKGYPELAKRAMLVLKTTQLQPSEASVQVDYVDAGGTLLTTAVEKVQMEAERIIRVGGNAFVDTRRLPTMLPVPGTWDDPKSLLDLYRSAHCFVFPTRGEGFGLTLAEAAATGLPSIYTRWSGPVDFMPKGGGYTLKFAFRPVKTIGFRPDKTTYVSHETTAASADILDIARKMALVMQRYDEALARGKIASDHILDRFTWDTSAAQFREVITPYAKRWEAA